MFVFRILNPFANAMALLNAGGLIFRHRGLVGAMTARELSDRYTNQVLGSAWAIISPLLTMLIYVWVFTFIFQGRLGNSIDDPTAFTAYALAGLAPWLAFADGVSRSIGAITNNANLVKQIVFPTEVLPLKIALATFPSLAIGLLFASAASVVAGLMDWERLLLLLPAAIACYMVMMAGLAYILATVSVFFRDIKDIVAFILGVGLFLNPIIYPPGGGPTALRETFNYNPIANMLFTFHHAVVGAVDQPNYAWYVFPIVSVVIFALGWRTFQTLKPTFGNAL